MKRIKTFWPVLFLAIAFFLPACTTEEDAGSTPPPTISGGDLYFSEGGGEPGEAPPLIFTVGTDEDSNPAFIANVDDGSGDAIWGTRGTSAIGFEQWTITGVDLTFEGDSSDGPSVGDTVNLFIVPQTVLMLFTDDAHYSSGGEFEGIGQDLVAIGEPAADCLSGGETRNMIAPIDAGADLSIATGRGAFGDMTYTDEGGAASFAFTHNNSFHLFGGDYPDTNAVTPEVSGVGGLSCPSDGNLENSGDPADWVYRTKGGLEMAEINGVGGYLMLPQEMATPEANGKTYQGVAIRPFDTDGTPGLNDGDDDVMIPVTATADGTDITVTIYEDFDGTTPGSGTITPGSPGFAPDGMFEGSIVDFGDPSEKGVFMVATMANGKLLVIGLVGDDHSDNSDFEITGSDSSEVTLVVLAEQ